MEWNVLGHEWAAKLLQQHIARDHVRHAYLFSGPPGVGRRTLALRFAQALNCPQPLAAGFPCGDCRACKQIEKMQYADLAVTQAEAEGGTLKVEQIRELQRSLSLAPYAGKYRLALLLRFEEANANAQNAFLKTLEEAPPRVILLLTADSPDNLLPTITSRCEVLRLRPLAVERLQAELVAGWKLDETAAARLAHLAEGRVGTALRLHASDAEINQQRAWLADLLRLLAAPRRERFAYAEKAAKDRAALRRMLLVWLSLWRDVFLRAGGANAPLINLDYADQIASLANRLDLATARARVADLEQGVRRLDANLNPRLLLEVLLLDMPLLE